MTASNALWAWNVRHSPIARRVRPHRHVQPLLATSGLSLPVQNRIDAVVRKTRLWADERADVARELIAHALDAMHADQPEPAILESLGEPRPIARLIRRAAKRKRGVLYQARRWCTRALAASFLLLTLVYAGMSVRFYTASPDVKVDYIALLNAPMSELADDDRAYPVYEETRIAWAHEAARLCAESSAEIPERNAGANLIPHIDDTHPDYPAVAEAVRAFRPQIDRLIEATQRPALGRPYSTAGTSEPVEGTTATRFVPDEQPPLASNQSWVIGILLPDLTNARAGARLLAFDAALAAREGDPDRAAANIGATFDLGAQLGREPFLISDLVAFAVYELGAAQLRRIIADHPGLFERDHLVQLSHTIARTRDAALTLDLHTEAYFFDDFLQRAYTDDGNGGGHLTNEGTQLFFTAIDTWNSGGDWNALGVIGAAARPAILAFDTGRRDQHRRYHGLIAAANEIIAEGPHAIWKSDRAYEELVHSDHGGPIGSPVTALAPAYGKAIASMFRVNTSADATAAILALEAWHARAGRYPDTLSELVPRLLPEIPADPFDPGEPIKYERRGDSFVLYSIGADADDDAGAPPERGHGDITPSAANFHARYRDRDTQPADPARPLTSTLNADDRPVDGDWVIYPPATPAN